MSWSGQCKITPLCPERLFNSGLVLHKKEGVEMRICKVHLTVLVASIKNCVVSVWCDCTFCVDCTGPLLFTSNSSQRAATCHQTAVYTRRVSAEFLFDYSGYTTTQNGRGNRYQTRKVSITQSGEHEMRRKEGRKQRRQRPFGV